MDSPYWTFLLPNEVKNTQYVWLKSPLEGHGFIFYADILDPGSFQDHEIEFEDYTNSTLGIRQYTQHRLNIVHSAFRQLIHRPWGTSRYQVVSVE